jgi:hypothetical protein
MVPGFLKLRMKVKESNEKQAAASNCKIKIAIKSKDYIITCSNADNTIFVETPIIVHRIMPVLHWHCVLQIVQL